MTLKVEGVSFRTLKQFPDERGKVMHYMRKSDSNFQGFAEAYFSVVNQGVVKGWKLHTKAVQNLVVVSGKVKFVVTDGKDIEEFELSPDSNYGVLKISAGVNYAFKCESSEPAIIANISTLEHDPLECVVKPLDEFNNLYRW